MASTAASLATMKAIYDQLLANYTDAIASPKPSYSVDGQSVSWNEYVSALKDQIKETRIAIIALSGPCSVITRGGS